MGKKSKIIRYNSGEKDKTAQFLKMSDSDLLIYFEKYFLKSNLTVDGLREMYRELKGIPVVVTEGDYSRILERLLIYILQPESQLVCKKNYNGKIL